MHFKIEIFTSVLTKQSNESRCCFMRPLTLRNAGTSFHLSFVLKTSFEESFNFIGNVFFLNFLGMFFLQGLFHPARKVRDVYWKVYNTLYISAQDSLVAAYPKVKDDDKNNYTRYEMDYFLQSLGGISVPEYENCHI